MQLVDLHPHLAEREGFEPPVRLRTPVFKTGVIDHSTIFPFYFFRTLTAWSKAVAKVHRFFDTYKYFICFLSIAVL